MEQKPQLPSRPSEGLKQTPEGASPGVKKPWSPPRLVEYGGIGKLTGASTGTVGDGLGMNMRQCL